MSSPPSRIVKVTYRSGVNGRVAVCFAKVPYSGTYAMTETLTRALTKNEVLWFRVEPAKPAEIETVRPSLKRWPEALRDTSERSKVTWLV